MFVLRVSYFPLQVLPQKRLVCRRNPFRIFEYLQLSLEEVMLPAWCFSAWASGLGDSVDKPSSVPFCLHLVPRPPQAASIIGLSAFHSSAFALSTLGGPFVGPAWYHPTEVSGGHVTRVLTSGFQIVQIPFYSFFFFTSYCRNMVPQVVKNPPAKWENWVGMIPWRRARQPTPVFLPEESPWRDEPGGAKSRTQLSD